MERPCLEEERWEKYGGEGECKVGLVVGLVQLWSFSVVAAGGTLKIL